MSFYLSDSSKQMYSKINENTPIMMWEYYYLCSMVGMTYCRSIPKDSSKEKRTEFVKSIPSEYADKKMGLIAALVTAELSSSGLQYSRDNIKDSFRKMSSDGEMSAEAMQLMDDYAQGGFELLTEEGPLAYDKIDFISKCWDLIKKCDDDRIY